MMTRAVGELMDLLPRPSFPGCPPRVYPVVHLGQQGTLFDCRHEGIEHIDLSTSSSALLPPSQPQPHQ